MNCKNGNKEWSIFFFKNATGMYETGLNCVFLPSPFAMICVIWLVCLITFRWVKQEKTLKNNNKYLGVRTCYYKNEVALFALLHRLDKSRLINSQWPQWGTQSLKIIGKWFLLGNILWYVTNSHIETWQLHTQAMICKFCPKLNFL